MLRWLRWLLALGTLLVHGITFAQAADVERLLANLRHEDFRVRTQAALALGASKNERAAKPLCAALTDENASVRAAAAAAIGRLALGGEECLEKRLETEANTPVKAAIQKALELIDGGEPKFGPDVQYYVAVGKLTDKSGRSTTKLETVVRKAMKSAGASVESFAIAPRHETPARAKERMAKHPRVKAYFLAPRLPAFEYEGGNLTVRLEVAMFSYPDKAMLGAYSVKLTQPDVSKPDPQSEDELVTMAAERAIEKFSKIVLSL